MEHLNEEEIGKIKQIFDELDMDRNGFIKADELESVMKALGRNYTEDELNETLIEFHTDPDGDIDLTQCTNMVAYTFSRFLSPASTTAAISEMNSPSLESFLMIASDEMDSFEAEIVIKYLKEGIQNALHSKDLGKTKKLVESLIDMHIQELTRGLSEKKQLNKFPLSRILGFLNFITVVCLFIVLFFSSGAKETTYYSGPRPT